MVREESFVGKSGLEKMDSKTSQKNFSSFRSRNTPKRVMFENRPRREVHLLGMEGVRKMEGETTRSPDVPWISTSNLGISRDRRSRYQSIRRLSLWLRVTILIPRRTRVVVWVTVVERKQLYINSWRRMSRSMSLGWNRTEYWERWPSSTILTPDLRFTKNKPNVLI